jgi:protein PhnA
VNVKDSKGNALHEGDTVRVIKDLKVRGSSPVVKRGAVVKNIRLTDIEGRVDKSTIVLRLNF